MGEKNQLAGTQKKNNREGFREWKETYAEVIFLGELMGEADKSTHGSIYIIWEI